MQDKFNNLNKLKAQLGIKIKCQDLQLIQSKYSRINNIMRIQKNCSCNNLLTAALIPILPKLEATLTPDLTNDAIS